MPPRQIRHDICYCIRKSKKSTARLLGQDLHRVKHPKSIDHRKYQSVGTSLGAGHRVITQIPHNGTIRSVTSHRAWDTRV